MCMVATLGPCPSVLTRLRMSQVTFLLEMWTQSSPSLFYFNLADFTRPAPLSLHQKEPPAGRDQRLLSLVSSTTLFFLPNRHNGALPPPREQKLKPSFYGLQDLSLDMYLLSQRN